MFNNIISKPKSEKIIYLRLTNLKKKKKNKEFFLSLKARRPSLVFWIKFDVFVLGILDEISIWDRVFLNFCI